jgi:hypothetical protein
VRPLCSQAPKPVGLRLGHAHTLKPSSYKKNFNLFRFLAIAVPAARTPLARSQRSLAQSLRWLLFICLAAGTLLSGLLGCNGRTVSTLSAAGNSPPTPAHHQIANGAGFGSGFVCRQCGRGNELEQAGNLDSEMTVNNLHIYFGGRNPGQQRLGR